MAESTGESKRACGRGNSSKVYGEGEWGWGVGEAAGDAVSA